MTVVLIDDERPALKIMTILLGKYPQMNIVGQFINPVKAVEQIPLLQPDIVFLDVDMPYMNGMETAARILESNPQTKIVFVTAYEKFALEAYQFHPMDYILKPVEEERLDKLIAYLQQPKEKPVHISDKPLMIRCFGDFCVKWAEEDSIKWRTEKTKEIFAFLVDHYASKIEKDQILDCLWPECDPDRALKQLYNGIYYIRKALWEYGAGNRILIDKSYSLKLKNVDFDVEQLKKLKKDTVSDLESMDKYMEGMYFEKQDYLWAMEKRETYFSIHVECLLRLASYHQEEKRYDAVEKLLLKAYKIDPYNETVVEKLLSLYLLAKDKIKGIRFYQEYEKLILSELGEKPNAILVEQSHTLRKI